MPRLSPTLFIAVLVIGCARAQSTGPALDPNQEAKALEQALQQRDQLAKAVAANSPELQQKCELMAGDCLIQLRERRSAFFETHHTLECPPVTMPDERMRCIARPSQSAEAAKVTQEVRELFSSEGRCLSELAKCASDLKTRAVVAARDARTEERRRQTERSQQAVAAQNSIEFAIEKIKYIRLTFPVQTDDLCAPSGAFDQCVEKAQQGMDHFEAMLVMDQGYDAQAALERYRSSKEGEAACYEPEFRCLAGQLKNFGASPETQALTQRNLRMLEKRQQLMSQVGETAAKQCLEHGIHQHQSDILQRYQDYVRETKMYFRFQLDRAFLAMHTSQVECLKNRAHPSSG
jgi:chorismate mutase